MPWNASWVSAVQTSSRGVNFQEKEEQMSTKLKTSKRWSYHYEAGTLKYKCIMKKDMSP